MKNQKKLQRLKNKIRIAAATKSWMTGRVKVVPNLRQEVLEGLQLVWEHPEDYS